MTWPGYCWRRQTKKLLTVLRCVATSVRVSVAECLHQSNVPVCLSCRCVFALINPQTQALTHEGKAGRSEAPNAGRQRGVTHSGAVTYR